MQSKQAKPFLKWAGGKKKLLNEIAKRLPDKLSKGVDKYVEPFVGGGAVFFFLASEYKGINKFYLFDINPDLVNCYTNVKSCVEELIVELAKMEKKFLSLDKPEQKEFFLRVRQRYNKDKSRRKGTDTAALMIFLNKTCFNGLYRVNRQDKFNVPFGYYKQPKICDADNLRLASKLLQKAEIICGDFEESKKFVDADTFVYLDPPYRPLTRTSAFTSYTKEDFSEKDQIRLARYCKQLQTMDVPFLLSNSDPKNDNKDDIFFETHYQGFFINKVKAPRVINCNGKKRGEISEIILSNYKFHQLANRV